MGLGMDVSHCDAGVIVVESVNPEGAAAMWNEEQRKKASQDPTSYTPFEVRAGDRIVRVNNVSGDAQKMLDECKAHNTLTLVVRRGNSHNSAASPCLGSSPPPKDFLGALGDGPFFLGGKDAGFAPTREPPGLEKLGVSLQ